MLEGVTKATENVTSALLRVLSPLQADFLMSDAKAASLDEWH